MIEAVVWVVVFILLAGCAYLVIRTVARGLRAYYEHTTLRRLYHEWCSKPTMVDLLKQNYLSPLNSLGETRMMYKGREVYPSDWNRKVEDFEKEHWSTAAEREIKARKPGSINYYHKKGGVPNGGTRGEKGSGNGADTE